MRPQYQRRLADRCHTPHWRGTKRDGNFVLAGARFRIVPARDRAVRQFLSELADEIEDAADAGQPISLMPFRNDLRKIIADRPVAGLTWYLLHGREILRPLVIWLLGRIGSRVTMKPVALFRCVDNRWVRRQAIKAMVRTGRISPYDLPDLLQSENDETLARWMRHKSRQRTFESRLGTFLKNDVQRHGKAAQNSGRGVQFHTTPAFHGRPPRSSWFIHHLLERIQYYVRNSDSPRGWLAWLRGRRKPSKA